MTKWIRWWGLIVFIGVTAAFLALFFMFVDGFVKRAIEKTGTALMGAKVELDKADLSFFPLGLRLSRLQVTDPDEPMTNAVEVSQIAFSMDTLNLLRHKVIIEEMAVDKVQFKTPRKSSGTLPHPPEETVGSSKKSLVEKLPLPSLEVPDVREILSKEELKSLKLIQSLRDEIQTEREKWQRQLDELPNKAKLEEYRSRIQKLKSAKKGGLEGILGGATDLIALRQDLKRELERINAAKGTLKNDLTRLQIHVHEATQAPMEDVRHLKEKYSLSPQGLSNISRMLWGQEIGHWIDTTLRWYRRLKPVMAQVAEQRKEVSVTKPIRGKGLDVHFKERNPVPDFLIWTALVSVEIPAGVLTGQIKNVTPDPDVLGVPLTFRFSGEKMKGLQSVKAEGEFNHIHPARPKDQARLLMGGYQIQNFNLSGSEDFPLALNKGLADFEAQAVVANEALAATITAGLKSIQISSGLPENAKPLAKAMASTLSGVKSFNFKADVSGTVKDYDLRLTSDLDRVLGEAIGKQVKMQADQFEARLKSAISEKVDREMADLKGKLGGLEGLMDELTARLKLGDGLIKELIKF